MALLSQGACNLSGLAYSLCEVIPKIREEVSSQTEGVNKHPIVRLYLE
jgi:hypothetical protein